MQAPRLLSYRVWARKMLRASNELMQCSKEPYSLDDLVGAGEELRGKFKAESLCGLEVDHQFELGGLDNRQVGGFLAPEIRPT